MEVDIVDGDFRCRTSVIVRCCYPTLKTEVFLTASTTVPEEPCEPPPLPNLPTAAPCENVPVSRSILLSSSSFILRLYFSLFNQSSYCFFRFRSGWQKIMTCTTMTYTEVRRLSLLTQATIHLCYALSVSASQPFFPEADTLSVRSRRRP